MMGTRRASAQSQPPRRSALEQALQYLARREHSQRELQRKLLGLGHVAEDVAQALRQLQTDGYLSDQRYAQMATRSLLARGKGPLLLRQKLGDAGIAGAMAEAALPTDLDWEQQARQVLQRRFGMEAPADLKAWAQRARFLLARGFGEHQVRAALGPRPSAPARDR